MMPKDQFVLHDPLYISVLAILKLLSGASTCWNVSHWNSSWYKFTNTRDKWDGGISKKKLVFTATEICARLGNIE